MTITIPLFEPQKTDYLFIDADNNVHLFVPVIAGEGIGLDNTCKTTVEIEKFLGLKPPALSALKQLEQYKNALLWDIEVLTHYKAEDGRLAAKKKILEQIKTYLSILPAKTAELTASMGFGSFKALPTQIKAVLDRKTNCFSILLSPEHESTYLRAGAPLFSLARRATYIYNNHEALGPTLRQKFILEFQKKDAKIVGFTESITKQAASGFNKPVVWDDKSIRALQEKIETYVKTTYDLVIDCKRTLIDNQLINQKYFELIYGVELHSSSPEAMVSSILSSSVSVHTWLEKISSVFTPIQTITLTLELRNQEAERLSIKTQFFLAIINIYCHGKGISKSGFNFGTVFDKKEPRESLADLVILNSSQGTSVENAILELINSKYSDDLTLTRKISAEEKIEIINKFRSLYITIANGEIEGSGHFDEYTLFEHDIPGDFFRRLNKISVHLADLMSADERTKYPSITNAATLLKAQSRRILPASESRNEGSNIELPGNSTHRLIDALPPSILISLEDGQLERVKSLLFGQHKIYDLLSEPGKKALKEVAIGKSSLLLDSVKKNKPADIDLLIKLGADINIKDDNDDTPLLWAVYYGLTECVTVLLENNANLTLRNNQNRENALDYAITRYQALIKPILLKGIKLSLAEQKEFLRTVSNGVYSLVLTYVAVEKPEFFDELLSQVEPTQILESIHLLLEYPKEKMNAQIRELVIKKLLNLDPDTIIRDRILTNYLKAGKFNLVRTLLFTKNNEGKSLWDVLLKHNKQALLDILNTRNEVESSTDKVGISTSLITHPLSLSNEVINFLLDNSSFLSADYLNLLIKSKLLINLLKDGEFEQVKAKLFEKNTEQQPLYDVLFKHNPSALAEIINTADKKGQTLFLRTVKVVGFNEDLAIYLKLGANINARDWFGDTALTWAVYNSNHSLATFLLEKNADASIRNKDQNNAFDIAISKAPALLKPMLLKANNQAALLSGFQLLTHILKKHPELFEELVQAMEPPHVIHRLGEFTDFQMHSQPEITPAIISSLCEKSLSFSPLKPELKVLLGNFLLELIIKKPELFSAFTEVNATENEKICVDACTKYIVYLNQAIKADPDDQLAVTKQNIVVDALRVLLTQKKTMDAGKRIELFKQVLAEGKETLCTRRDNALMTFIKALGVLAASVFGLVVGGYFAYQSFFGETSRTKGAELLELSHVNLRGPSS